MRAFENWYCPVCSAYNDILNGVICRHCKKGNAPEFVTFRWIGIIEIQRDVWRTRLDEGLLMAKESKEELFVKFYNKGKLLVLDMTREQLRDHIMELEEIALEAKASLQAARDQERENNKSVKNKEWLVNTDSDSSQSVTDAIAAVKQRKSRMSAIDKVRKNLEDAGLDEDAINEMVAKMEKNATDKGIKKFNTGEVRKATIAVERATTETVAVVLPVEEKKPFNPAGLTFGKK